MAIKIIIDDISTLTDDEIMALLKLVRKTPSVSLPNETEDIIEEPETEKIQDDSLELDSTGLPWDARIHAATKAKTQNGEWRSRRGVSESEAAPIVAQLRAAVNAPRQEVLPDARTVSYIELIPLISKALSSGAITQLDITNALISMQLGDFSMLQHRLDLIPQLLDKLGIKP